jgi:hypothetical protein
MNRPLLGIVMWLSGGFLLGIVARLMDWGDATFGVAALVLVTALTAITIALHLGPREQ